MKYLIEAISNKSVLNHFANAKSTVLFEFLNNFRKTPNFLQKKPVAKNIGGNGVTGPFVYVHE
jgi:hypothetical protein